MARLDPAIRHAITPPEFGEEMLHREHLVDRLHGEVPRSLVAIAAPAGYGKTTLLADFVHHTDIPVAWVRLSEDDRDVMRLASVLVSSLETKFRRLRDLVDLRAYAEASATSVARVFHNLIEEHIPETFAIVIDDVHLVHGSDEAMEFLDEFLLELPENVVVFAAGRQVAEVSLARLMAEGRLAGLGPHDLALTYEEATELIKVYWEEPPTEDGLRDLMEKTKGWVTGILLSEHSSATIDLAGGLSENLAYEYLATVALNRMPDRLRSFLLQVSVLPYIRGDTADAILGRQDSEILLQEASRLGLFISASSGDPVVYRFHPMFRELLQETLKATDADKFEELRQGAASLLEKESPELAVQLYLESNQGDKAAELVEELASSYYQLGRYGSLHNWHQELSGRDLSTPSLAYYLADLLRKKGDHKGALERLDDTDWGSLTDLALTVRALVLKATIWIHTGAATAEEIQEIVTEADGLAARAEDPLSWALVYFLKARYARFFRNDLNQASDLIDSAIDHARSSGDDVLLSELLRQKMALLVEYGRLLDAMALASEANDLAEIAASPLFRASIRNDIAHINYLRGNYETALSLFDEASDHARLAASKSLHALTLFGKAEVFSDIGLVYQSARHYADGLELASAAQHKNLIGHGCIGTSVLHRRSRSYGLARDWIGRAQEIGNSHRAGELQIQKSAIIAQSDPEIALDTLRRVQKDELPLTVGEETLLHFWMAFADYKLGRHSHSKRSFRRALQVATLASTEQFVAAELLAEHEFYDYISDAFAEDPVFEVIHEFAETMQAIKRFYSDDEDESPEELKVYALDGVVVNFQDHEVDELKPQTIEFLLYLIDGGPVDKDRAGAEFWPEHPPGRQTANLHMAVYSIRKLLGKHMIELEGNVYRLPPSSKTQYDVDEFERAVDVARRLPHGDARRFFALTEAVSLYKGPFMPEYFSNWVQERRTQLELEYLDVAAELAEEALRRDQPIRALGPLREALGVDPYREDLNLHYLQLLKRLERRTDVISHYRKYAELLRRDFDLEPAQAAREVHQWAVGNTGPS